MFPWQEFTVLILKGMVSVYTQVMFWLVLALVGFQYRRMRQDQLKLFGHCNFSLWRQVAFAAAYGTAGGFFGSLLLNFFGVAVNQLGLEYIWPLAIILLLINLRFMCFAYAGGLVALSSVLFGWPEVNVPQVLALVAILHITESILIYISGRYGAMPLILKLPSGRLAGAFNLQNFWPLPLVLMMAVTVPESGLPGELFNMPDWWPLLPIGGQPPAGETWLYGMIPVVAALGYTDLAVTSTPTMRRKHSAINLAAYSVLLLLLAVLSVKYSALQILAAVIAPLGHELLIQLDHRREKTGSPRFVPPPRGLMVLDTVRETPARKLGLKPGDILLEFNGARVDNAFELAGAISFSQQDFTVLYEREGKTIMQQGRFLRNERRFGVILAPQGYEQNFVEMADQNSWVLQMLKKLRKND